jgi:hypothetical protein
MHIISVDVSPHEHYNVRFIRALLINRVHAGVYIMVAPYLNDQVSRVRVRRRHVERWTTQSASRQRKVTGCCSWKLYDMTRIILIGSLTSSVVREEMKQAMNVECAGKHGDNARV